MSIKALEAAFDRVKVTDENYNSQRGVSSNKVKVVKSNIFMWESVGLTRSLGFHVKCSHYISNTVHKWHSSS